MKLKIKLLEPDAVIPEKANETDAGLDLYAAGSIKINDHYIEYGTGLAMEIPVGYVGFLFPRSSISKTRLNLANSVGVVDAGYRGEVRLRFRYPSKFNLPAEERYRIGDKIGQLIVMPIPNVEIEKVDDLSPSARDKGGFGSSGK